MRERERERNKMSDTKTQKILKSFQSPAMAYEISLTELEKTENSKDKKIVRVFDILVDLVPTLVIYTQLMKMIRQQLFGKLFLLLLYASDLF